MAAYLDSATAAPVRPEAQAALLAAAADGWADPARLYAPGRRARLLLEAARETVAECIGARPEEVSFAPSGVQALHAAVLGTVRANRRRGPGLVHSAVEHSAVLQAARSHAAAGGRTASIGVDRLGRVDAAAFVAAAHAPDVAAAALQAANH
ncbi:MAG: aminotransferase class V-fold PLP-dependent enzyme, partial [Pseudonocardia sp.]|nr:aminotransferase class V-fold PLP-dependent enzyme [Pseudonocardia sp.]